MKVSTVTTADVAEYLRLDPGETDSLLEPVLEAARSYIRGYTGLDDEAIDAIPDAWAALMVLCQDMYDNRTMYVDRSGANLNRVVDSILAMHRENFC